ncbi:hypothetical protein IT399_03450 [Candidatus Nomurabacteria bacterium]|nr:hypothetical protein [Candidatus Nomurabacteria bacterium]
MKSIIYERDFSDVQKILKNPVKICFGEGSGDLYLEVFPAEGEDILKKLFESKIFAEKVAEE